MSLYETVVMVRATVEAESGELARLRLAEAVSQAGFEVYEPDEEMLIEPIEASEGATPSRLPEQRSRK